MAQSALKLECKPFLNYFLSPSASKSKHLSTPALERASVSVVRVNRSDTCIETADREEHADRTSDRLV